MTSFKIFLSLVFSSLNIIYLRVYFLVFIMLGIFWASWVYSVMSVVNVGKFPAIIDLNISYVTFSLLPLLLSQLHVWHIICNHISLEYSSHFFHLFFLCISIWEVSTGRQAHWFFYWPYPVCSWAHLNNFLFL